MTTNFHEFVERSNNNLTHPKIFQKVSRDKTKPTNFHNQVNLNCNQNLASGNVAIAIKILLYEMKR